MNNILYIYTFLCLNRYKNRVYRELGEQRESLSLEKREEAEPLRGAGEAEQAGFAGNGASETRSVEEEGSRAQTLSVHFLFFPAGLV